VRKQREYVTVTMTMMTFGAWILAALHMEDHLLPRSPYVDQADLHHSEAEYLL
jgi:hypothetical protein